MPPHAVIYAAQSKAVRRIVVSDEPDYDYSQHVGGGEAHVVVGLERGADLFAAARRAVKEETGVEPPEPLVAVVAASGIVTAMILADPVLDTIEGSELIPAYAGVAIGQTYDKATDSFIVPTTIFPAGASPDGTPYPEQIVVAHPVPKPE